MSFIVTDFSRIAAVSSFTVILILVMSDSILADMSPNVVSVLTVPEKLTAKEPAERPKEIQIGRDGLVVGRGGRRGLLLPQVAPEWKWDAEEFLSHCCLKAGLPPDAWLDKDTCVEKFQAVVFEETEPSGEVRLKEL